MPSLSRRSFIKQSALGTTGLLGALYNLESFALPPAPHNPLYQTSRELVNTWGHTLLSLQVTDKSNPHYGTIIYPPENIVHGRMGDCFYPFLHLAAAGNNSAYLDAAILLYRWMERTVSQDDGSWLNEPKKGSWKGTTVFSTIALAEAVKHHGHLLDNTFKQEVTARLQKSGNFIHTNFSTDYGNINYPVTATYALSLLGELLDEPRFTQRGKELAHQVLPFITKEGFLSGEGTPYHTPSAKGCLSADLGYNVEESLPSLVLYGLLTKDKEVLEAVQQLLDTHLEFMLPDGGWDNSWGTRNYKWTYWGSRTSDGCQPAYALMAGNNPVFYKAALANTQLLQSCTHNGLLYGGPHYHSHGVSPSLHHTFCHIKALVTILDHGIPTPEKTIEKVQLPREKAYGSKFFSDIQTGLIAKGKFRATVTGYDRNYKDFKGGHASGGALSMLWHEKAGIILAASMNEYQLYEANNMQQDTDPLSTCLTPRIELKEGGKLYMNIHDFSASVAIEEKKDTIIVHTISKLVNKEQQSPPSGPVHCQVSYHFSDNNITLHLSHNSKVAKIMVPVISPSTEVTHFSEIKSGSKVLVSRKGASLLIAANKTMKALPTTGKRIFNFVPGLEAIPLCIEEPDATVNISVLSGRQNHREPAAFS
jgi:hypothetical protein